MNSFNERVKTDVVQLRDWLSRGPVCQLSPQVSLHARKGMVMVQVGQSVEVDERLRAHDNPPNEQTRLTIHPPVLWDAESPQPRKRRPPTMRRILLCTIPLHRDRE